MHWIIRTGAVAAALGLGDAGCDDEDECFPDNHVELVREQSGVEVTLRGVVMSESGAAVAVGDRGTIIRRSDDAWSEQASGVDVDLLAIASPHPTSAKMLAVGAGGTILRSLDGGESWKSIASGTSAELDAVWMAERDGLAIAVGDGVVVRSENAGFTWSMGQVPEGVGTLRGVAGREGDVVAVGDDGLVLRSVDAGVTWVRVASGTTDDLLAIALDSYWYPIEDERPTRFRITGADGSVRQFTEAGDWEDFGHQAAPIVAMSRDGAWSLASDDAVHHFASGPTRLPAPTSALLAVDGSWEGGLAVGDDGAVVRMELVELGCEKGPPRP
ncbi:hypothetical protein [Nannocystis sp. SCPEA4]|uniref:WD40/YVTN/BNR-like repeat-containing protein n=1 Tax=Nannocystis sp. SCPEA4 TaxID=2996787 RepID=UPI00226D4E42|nr:hypothetical protein [Nannocystis sp. SCPEA4]MCY1061086.1 hypothetical protein [Nannocystis sp. SCPEA4]